MDLIAEDVQLINLSTRNVILGKNGSGKSHVLRKVQEKTVREDQIGEIRYISPERGGVLQVDPSVEGNIANNENWFQTNRLQNMTQSFRQQSTYLFRRLETLSLREIDSDRTKPPFRETINLLNTLLDRVKIDHDSRKNFRITVIADGIEVAPSAISSGESELISLGIEILSFVKEAVRGKNNFLLIDEPDVHLHPDLQDRLAKFMVRALDGQPITLVIATHSTPFLAGLAQSPDTNLAFKRQGDQSLLFRPVTKVDRLVLPIFGAHPLSNVFNEKPILIVEGDDDERVWQQAVRSSDGVIKVFPCVAGGVSFFPEFEFEVNALMDAVYDDAKGFSLRDCDLKPGEIDDEGHLIRMKLACRAAENLMLTDDALEIAGTDWAMLKTEIEGWVDRNRSHRYHSVVERFAQTGFDRKGADLKDIRNVLVGLMSNKPWEVLVGHSIAALARSGGVAGEGSLRDFLGEKVCRHLLKLDR